MSRRGYATISNEKQMLMVDSIPSWTVFVDPGPTCGVIVAEEGRHFSQIGTQFDEYYVPQTLSERKAQDVFAQFILRARRKGVASRLIIEEYRLYPQDANRQIGKTFPTSECIGGFKFIARSGGCEVTERAAQVKQPTEGMIKARGIPLIGDSEHSRDAELLMWHTILSNPALKDKTI